MKKQSILVFTLVLLLVSCEEFTNWRTEPQPRAELVVQAVLTDEAIRQEILLSLSAPGPNGSFQGVTDARLRLDGPNQSWAFIHDSSRAGHYLSQEALFLEDSLPYELSIEWKGEIYKAQSRLSEVLPLPSIVLDTVRGKDSLRTLNTVGDIFDPNQDAMYEVHIDWSQVADSGLTEALAYFYSFSTIHINELIRPGRENLFFPKGSTLVIKKYGLSKDFAFYLKSMLIETQWNGNFYFSQASNTPTNIEPKAWGYFSLCKVKTDTLLVE